MMAQETASAADMPVAARRLLGTYEGWRGTTCCAEASADAGRLESPAALAGAHARRGAVAGAAAA